MFEHMARKRRLASLAPAALLMVVVAGCSSAGTGAAAAGVTTGNAAEHFQAEGPRTVAATTQSKSGWQVGLSGTHPGGGGPQR
jgi:hypothetical protein